MTAKSGFRTLASLAIVWLALGCGVSAFGDTLRLGGSGSTTALAKLLASAYNAKYPQDSIIVTPALGTAGGLKALAVNAVSVALVSRPLTGSESGLRATEFARTPFVLTVAATNPKSNVGFAELAALLAATEPTWPDGTRVRWVLRPAQDNDSKIVASFSPAVAKAWDAARQRNGAYISATDEETISSIQRLPGGIGFTTLGQILADKRPLKALSIEYMVPNVSAIQDGSYPYFKRHFLVSAAQVTPVIERFMAFAVSPEAQALLSAHGSWVGTFQNR